MTMSVLCNVSETDWKPSSGAPFAGRTMLTMRIEFQNTNGAKAGARQQLYLMRMFLDKLFLQVMATLNPEAVIIANPLFALIVPIRDITPSHVLHRGGGGVNPVCVHVTILICILLFSFLHLQRSIWQCLL